MDYTSWRSRSWWRVPRCGCPGGFRGSKLNYCSNSPPLPPLLDCCCSLDVVKTIEDLDIIYDNSMIMKFRGRSRRRVQWVCTPPPLRWSLFFIFTFKICWPYQSWMLFLSGTPPPEKNPGYTHTHGSFLIVSLFFTLLILLFFSIKLIDSQMVY